MVFRLQICTGVGTLDFANATNVLNSVAERFWELNPFLVRWSRLVAIQRSNPVLFGSRAANLETRLESGSYVRRSYGPVQEVIL